MYSLQVVTTSFITSLLRKDVRTLLLFRLRNGTVYCAVKTAHRSLCNKKDRSKLEGVSIERSGEVADDSLFYSAGR